MAERMGRLGICIIVRLAFLVEQLGSRVERLVGIVARGSASVGFDVRVAVDGAEGLLVGKLGDVARDDEAAV